MCLVMQVSVCSSGIQTLVRNVNYQYVAYSCYKGSLVLQFCLSSCLELCFLCDTPITIKFDPCEHSVVCEQCARRASKCPHCKVSCLESKLYGMYQLNGFMFVSYTQIPIQAIVKLK